MDKLKLISDWFKSNCNGDWEHGYGIKIETMDNPGWKVEVYLYDTELEDKSFDKIMLNNGDNDWMCCNVENYFFIGMGDVDKLELILDVFCKWKKI